MPLFRVGMPPLKGLRVRCSAPALETAPAATLPLEVVFTNGTGQDVTASEIAVRLYEETHERRLVYVTTTHWEVKVFVPAGSTGEARLDMPLTKATIVDELTDRMIAHGAGTLTGATPAGFTGLAAAAANLTRAGDTGDAVVALVAVRFEPGSQTVTDEVRITRASFRSRP